MNVKRKGSEGERELLRILKENGFTDAERNDQRYIGGFVNPDISLTYRETPMHIEVKRVEKLNIASAISQAVTDSGGLAFPVVIHRSNKKPWLVTFRLSDFLNELEKYRRKGSEPGSARKEKSEGD